MTRVRIIAPDSTYLGYEGEVLSPTHPRVRNQLPGMREYWDLFIVLDRGVPGHDPPDRGARGFKYDEVEEIT